MIHVYLKAILFPVIENREYKPVNHIAQPWGSYTALAGSHMLAFSVAALSMVSW